MCPETYGFEQEIVPGPGLIREDKLLLDRTLLPKQLKLGIASGRTLGEIVVSFRLAGLSDDLPRDRVVAADDGVKKPDPEVLRLAVERTGGTRPMYVGDQPDDHRTVVRYRELGRPMLSCMVLTGLRHPEAKQFFEDNGVDLIADNVNAAMHAVTSMRRGTRRARKETEDTDGA
jgi:phosphoglycolate phosphatase-like HAD superfamily hydrolase